MRQILWGVVGVSALLACSGCSSANTKATDAGATDSGTIDDTGSGADTTPSETGDDTGGGETGDETGTAPTSDAACADWAAKYCAALGKCSAFSLGLHYDTNAMCVERTKIACKDALDSPVGNLTGSWQAACTTALAAWDCKHLLLGLLPDACKPPPGKQDKTAGCAWSSDCASGYCAHVDNGNGASCGLCDDAPGEGAACGGKGKDECGFGLVCAQSKCVRPVDADGACSDAAPCLAGLECYMDKCVPGLKEGATCDPDATTTPSCDSSQGLACGMLGVNSCTAPVVGTAGGDCSPGVTFICPAGVCGSTDKCPAYAGEGASCAGEEVCVPGAICDSGTCRTPSAKFCSTSPG